MRPTACRPNALDERRLHFAGETVGFGAMPLSMNSGTDFERAVWKALSAITYGEIHTYGHIAARGGRARGGPSGRHGVEPQRTADHCARNGPDRFAPFAAPSAYPATPEDLQSQPGCPRPSSRVRRNA